MTQRVSNTVFARFKKLMLDAHDTFNQDTIIWRKKQVRLNRFGRETGSENEFLDIPIKGLMDFNYFRKWPTAFMQISGSLDRQTSILLLNVEYLIENNWANENGRLNYDPGFDKFVYRNVVYRPMGDTFLSQNFNEPLIFDILLQREELSTGETYNNVDI